jgi:5-carboxymethyl-2-hydroxymuconic-semialdehyde dehydrogenase
MSAPTGHLEINNIETNLRKAQGFLERFRGAPLGHFIAGKAESGAAREIFDNVSPVDGRVINQVVCGDEQDVNAAALAAEAAFPAWRAKSGEERRAILLKVANAIEARREEIACVECMDTGQALRFMSGAALRAAENFRFFADRAPGAANGLALPATEHRLPMVPATAELERKLDAVLKRVGLLEDRAA